MKTIHRKRKRRSKLSSGIRPWLESLEPRLMMAGGGDVAYWVTGYLNNFDYVVSTSTYSGPSWSESFSVYEDQNGDGQTTADSLATGATIQIFTNGEYVSTLGQGGSHAFESQCYMRSEPFLNYPPPVEV